MGQHRWKEGQSGNLHGRPPASREKFNWTFLDMTAIPAATRHLYAVVTGEDEDWQRIETFAKKVETRNRAASALLDKAPQRHAGADGEVLDCGVIVMPISRLPDVDVIELDRTSTNVIELDGANMSVTENNATEETT